MKFSNTLFGKLLATASLLEAALAQTVGSYTDEDTGITFETWTVSESSTTGGMVLGVALPEDALTMDSPDFIGYLKCSTPTTPGEGWCGMSMSGPMTSSLLLMAWPYGDEVLTNFLFASGYDNPEIYEGNAALSQIKSTIDDDGFELLFRCENCFAADDVSTVSTSGGILVLGWAQSTTWPTNPECPADVSVAEQHDNGEGIFGGSISDDAIQASYSDWIALATGTPTGECDGDSTATPTSTATATSQPVPAGISYDYIVVGGGAGGIPMADKLSEAGNSVLLIEKGPPSSGRWGGDMKPDWLDGTNLTRFDVPGLCNQIWKDSADIACTDTDQMAGCVLGGGTAVNAGLWWKPYSLDWDYVFPAGWKSDDMSSATSNVFSRIPGTDTPSMDGELYLQQGYGVISGGLESNGWTEIALNGSPDSKNHTFGHTPYMFSNGERGGPMSTYLVSASERSNFDMWTGTAVKRLIRTRGHITGLEVEAFLDGGYEGTVGVTSVTGRVVLSAGTFGTPKILYRSGIGRSDQLEIVAASADGTNMMDEDDWLILPVGNNVVDHVNTDTVITHPDVVNYDFYEAYTDPIEEDADSYLDSRTGILAQAAPNIGPLAFDQIQGSDGIVRQIQWTARVEGGHDTPDGSAMVISQYLGRGSTSRGQMSIDSSLNTYVSTLPYLIDQADVDVVIQGIENLMAALTTVDDLTFTYPADGTSVEDFVNNMVVSYSNRRANHWMGTCKMGADDARIGGSAVVDTNTKVWGTDNLFVMDASIFPGMVSTNPSAYIVIASEHAAAKIMDLATAQEVPRYGQCDGINWNGSYICAGGYTCTYQNDYYSQCL
ncbi:carbohydrate-binding module family 1 protein [Zalerion maritima]|uniref:Carbohydrate-binding module family 1 protein n=1 Tax=Zalerion maritima TaxID=339359 RepID=A0AAD5RM73_9PEZI|nr:carbohydrate-binding module family 1 protein [Zalerion maritima]